MGDHEGSRAMTIYIVVCFVLAMGALVAYKTYNDRRVEAADDYVKLAEQYADISAAYSRNIRQYYRMKNSGELDVVDKDYRDNTHVMLRQLAEKLGITQRTGGEDRLTITPKSSEKEREGYNEYTVDVKLQNVTQGEWTTFVRNARSQTYKYARISSIKVNRDNQRFDRIKIVDNVDRDRTLWTVEMTFIWFEERDDRQQDER